jgi:hypothetical protein
VPVLTGEGQEMALRIFERLKLLRDVSTALAVEFGTEIEELIEIVESHKQGQQVPIGEHLH